MTKSERKRLCAACRAMFPGQKIALFQKALRKQRKEEKEQERLTRKGARAAVRAECSARAPGRCEFCGIATGLLEMDHFYGRKHESKETCWMLCRSCHRAKTENEPTRKAWDYAFRIHCGSFGYPFKPRFGGRPKADARNEPPDSNSGARESR